MTSDDRKSDSSQNRMSLEWRCSTNASVCQYSLDIPFNLDLISYKMSPLVQNWGSCWSFIMLSRLKFFGLFLSAHLLLNNFASLVINGEMKECEGDYYSGKKRWGINR